MRRRLVRGTCVARRADFGGVAVASLAAHRQRQPAVLAVFMLCLLPFDVNTRRAGCLYAPFAAI